MLVHSGSSCCELPNHPIGPVSGPVLDVWSFDEPQHEHCMLHWVHHLFCINVRQVVKVELVDEHVHKGACPIKIRRMVSPQLPVTPASTSASWWSSTSWWSSAPSSRWSGASTTSWPSATSSGWSSTSWWFPSWSTFSHAWFSEKG